MMHIVTLYHKLLFDKQKSNYIIMTTSSKQIKDIYFADIEFRVFMLSLTLTGQKAKP